MAYESNFGTLLSKTNHLNQTVSFVYDTWQRKAQEKDIYNNITEYFYEWITSGDFINGIRSRIVDASGATKETLVDNWGRKRLERGLSINSKWIEKRTEYDVLDRAYKVSEPYFSTVFQANGRLRNMTCTEDLSKIYSRPEKLLPHLITGYPQLW